MKFSEIKDFKDLGKLTRSRGFKAMLIFGIAKKLLLLGLWLLPELY